MASVGISEVARLAGVSTATVSRALSGRGAVSAATKQLVEIAAAELDYVVSSNASSLASGRTRNIGVLLPVLDRWYFTSVLSGAQRALLHAGYDLTLYSLDGSGSERTQVFEHFLLRQRVDAVIAVSLELSPQEVPRLHELRKPVVGIGGPIPGVPTVSIDDIAIATLATEHLLALGHTRIGHIGGAPEFDADFHLPRQRQQGYEEALRAADLAPDPRIIRNADFTTEGGYRAAKQLLGLPARERPTAIFAASDEMAIGAMLAARDLGLEVPGELSVVGVDDHDLAEFFGLTTVAQFPREQGAHAVSMLLEELESGAPQLDSLMQFELRVRSSTIRPRP